MTITFAPCFLNSISLYIILYIRIYGNVYMSSVGVFIRIDKELLDKFTRIAESLGMSRSEAIRKAMEMFIEVNSKETMTSKMRGLVKSKLSLRELEEAYLVSR